MEGPHVAAGDPVLRRPGCRLLAVQSPDSRARADPEVSGAISQKRRDGRTRQAVGHVEDLPVGGAQLSRAGGRSVNAGAGPTSRPDRARPPRTRRRLLQGHPYRVRHDTAPFSLGSTAPAGALVAR